MKRPFYLFFAVLILALAVSACGKSVPTPPTTTGVVSSCSGSESLRILSDLNARLILEGPDGLVARFEKAEGKKVCVDYIGGPEAQRIKSQILSKKSDSFTGTDYHAMIFDSAIYAENLIDQVYPGQTYPGIWLRKDSADRLGLKPGQILTQEQYARYMENGQLKMITASAIVDTSASLTFFNTLSGYYGPYNQLTLEQVQDEGAIEFGKRIYDHYSKSPSNPIQLAFSDTMSGQNLYDGVVGFESAFLGGGGLNQQLVNSGKQPFVFFYFNPSVEAKITMGRAPSIPDGALEVYTAFAKFVMTEESQLYILSVGIHPQKNIADPDLNVFKPEWGLLVSPAVDFAAPPTPSVARAALEVYRDLYKRAKEVNIIIDTSGSTEWVDVPVYLPDNFNPDSDANLCGYHKDVIIQTDLQGHKFYNIPRLQAIACGIATFSNSEWLKANGVKPGPNDVINYWFFSDNVSQKAIASSVGPNTDEASVYVLGLIGPTRGSYDWGRNSDTVAQTVLNKDGAPFRMNGTSMFDAAYYVNEVINRTYDPNVDYYIVILTDGENKSGWSGREYYSYWLNNHKLNITLTGIQFGGDGGSIAANFTQQFGGDSFVGTSSEGLVKAFEKIFGN